MDHDLRRARLRLLVIFAAVALVAVFIAISATSGGAPRATLSAGASDATTTTVEETTTTTLETTTTEAPARTTTTRRLRSVVSTIVSTLPLKPLVLNSIRVGVGAPCRDAATTTTNNAAGEHDIDGCYFFVFYPLEQQALHVRLVSDRGYTSDIYGPPCQESDGQCHGYMGAVYDRQPGDRECFWLVTVEVGWVPLSNQVCIDWRARP